MCLVNAYLLRDNKEELLVQNVETIESAGDELLIQDIYGNRFKVTAEIRGLDMVNFRVLLVENFAGGAYP